MSDLELAASTFVDRFMELVDLAKHEASQEFAAERQRHEALVAELRAAVASAESVTAAAEARADAAAAGLESLRTALAGLTNADHL